MHPQGEAAEAVTIFRLAASRREGIEESPQVIAGLFPIGASIVWGPPGCGKSTLAVAWEEWLSLRHAIAGKVNDEPVRTLILDFEGSQHLTTSMSLRLDPLGTLPTDEGPGEGDDYCVHDTEPPGRDYAERLDHLRNRLADARDEGKPFRYVRIDTLRRFAGPPPQGMNTADWDSLVGGSLDRLAEEFELALVQIAHPNKAKELSGSVAVSGSVSAEYQFKPNKDEGEGLLKCHKNRKGAETDWALTFDRVRGTWTFTDALTTIQVVNTGHRRKVADHLTKAGRVTAAEITDAVSLTREQVKEALQRLHRAGQAAYDREKRWFLIDPETGEAPAPGTPVPVRVKGTCVACGEDMTVIVSGQTMHPCCEPETVPPACDIPDPGGDDATAPAGFNAYKVMQDTLEASPLHPLWFIPVADREAGAWPAAIQASSTAQHAHKWTRPDLQGFGAGRVILPLDRHQSYPGSCNGVAVAAGKLMHSGGLDHNPKDDRLAGICEVMVPDWPHEDRIGHPLGRDAVPGRSLWVPSGQVEQLWKLHEQGCITRPVVVDSWLGRRTTSLFDAYQVAVRDARAAASTPEEVTAVKFHSSVAIRKLHPVEAKSQQWRPDWHAAICAEAATRLWAVAWRAVEAGGELAWMGSCDACAWIVPEDANDGWLPPGYLLGDGPGTYHHGSFRVPVAGSRDTETIEGPAVLNTWLRRRG